MFLDSLRFLHDIFFLKWKYFLTKCFYKIGAGNWDRSSHPEMFYKKLFPKISQNSQEIPFAWVSFYLKFADWTSAILLTKRRQHRCFFVKFVKFLRIAFLQNPSGGPAWLRVSSQHHFKYHNQSKFTIPITLKQVNWYHWWIIWIPRKSYLSQKKNPLKMFNPTNMKEDENTMFLFR